MLFVHSVKTQDLLQKDLERAGICPGQNLIMHTSLKSVGKMEKGAETLAAAVLSTIGDSANFLVPTFTYSLSGWKAEPFHRENSTSRTGAFTEYLRKRPDAVRSVHPTHSVAVIGPDSNRIIANHLAATPLGINSPFYRMMELDAVILMLGTRQDTNSSLHLCEVLAKIPYVNVGFTDDMDYELAWLMNAENQIEFHPIREIPGCSRGFTKIEPALKSAGVLHRAIIGNAECQLLNLQELAEASRKILEENPMLLLCDIPNCAICPRRRRFMQNLE